MKMTDRKDIRKFDRRQAIAVAILLGFVTAVFIAAFVPYVSGASPSISYADPDNGATHVYVDAGDGVDITVNVTDADADIQQVVLKWNNSGTWTTFYDSGALGGVSYHNVTVLNTNFTGSWVTYEYQICAYDTVWTNTTYSFTTGYVWGDPNCVYLDDEVDLKAGAIYKFNDTTYFLRFTTHASDGDADTYILQYSTDTNPYGLTATKRIDGTLPLDGYGFAVYDNKLYTWTGGTSTYAVHPTYCLWWDGSWHSFNYGTQSGDIAYYERYLNYYSLSCGFVAKYYNGEWLVVCGRTYVTSNGWYRTYLEFGRIDNPADDSISVISNIDKKVSYDYNIRHWCPSLEIFEGKLVLTYINSSGYPRWKTYDGSNWVDKGTIGNSTVTRCSMVKDPVNEQLVVAYIRSGSLYYRTLSVLDGSWSSEKLIFTPISGKSILDPHLEYINHRIVITLSYDLRGTYNIYTISEPDYMSEAHGVFQQYNRIQFPDARPSDTRVNSSVFYYKNIGSRTITEINITFSDIGSIQCESNFKLWGSTDNVSWTDLGTTDASGFLGPINSATWDTGMNWETGDMRYFKLEILDVGAVVEDLHNTDESIVWEITLA